MSASTVQVRAATPADHDFIVASNVAMAVETEDKGLVPDTLAAGVTHLMAHPAEGLYFVAEDQGTPVGTLMVTYEWSDWRNGRFWWIQSVYVAAAARRQGVYRAMHAHVHALALTDPQAVGLRLYVERENSIAQATYDNLGMHETVYRLYQQDFER